MMVPFKVARQTQHFIRTMSPPADLLQLLIFAINWRPTCYYIAHKAVMCPSHFCRVRVTSPSSQSRVRVI